MPALPSYNLEAVKFLVAERNRNMRAIIRQILRTFGAREVREAGDGAEALKIMQTFVPDIITTGRTMMPLDGIEFTRMVRRAADSPCPMAPIIMITAHSEAQRVREARDAGITEFVAKPISARSLYLRIVTCIEKPRPFVKAPGYVGPCRHRHDDSVYAGPRRRNGEESQESREAAP